jgi:hypothetical protein
MFQICGTWIRFSSNVFHILWKCDSASCCQTSRCQYRQWIERAALDRNKTSEDICKNLVKYTGTRVSSVPKEINHLNPQPAPWIELILSNLQEHNRLAWNVTTSKPLAVDIWKRTGLPQWRRKRNAWTQFHHLRIPKEQVNIRKQS